MLNLFERAKLLLDTRIYEVAEQRPEFVPIAQYPVAPKEHCYILRMMLKGPKTGIQIPQYLNWIAPSVYDCIAYHIRRFEKLHPYIYLTVRNGPVTSVSDDLWHVDGFSMRIPHVPEQNYIFTDKYHTEYPHTHLSIPNDFDPLKHNIHKYFQDTIDKIGNVEVKSFHGWNLVDPYVIHRRPRAAFGENRLMVRVSFVPIEIKSNDCTPNHLMDRTYYPAGDIRDTLISYKV